MPPRRTENRERRTERPVNGRRRNCRGVGRSPTEKAKPLNFQASNLPCTPGTSATCHGHAPQEIQEIQDMQERPYGATGGAPCKHLGALAGKEGLPFSLGSIHSTGCVVGAVLVS